MAAEPSSDRSRSLTIMQADWSMYNHDPAECFNPAEEPLSPAKVGKRVEKRRFPDPDSSETIGVVHANHAARAGHRKK